MTKYNSDHNARIVNRNGRWQAQRLGSEKGSRTVDPWFDVGHPKETAIAAAAVVGITL